MRNVVLATTALLLAGGASAAIVVPNGDFEAGNTSFTSGYTYVAPTGQMALYPEATYTVDTNANNVHNLWASYGDHTTGKGKYLIVNGAETAGVPVWTSGLITVTPNKRLNFSAWIASSYPTSPAVLTFSVERVGGGTSDIVTFTGSTTTGVWSQAGGNFLTQGATQIRLNLLNANTAANGNDFGIDDITLTNGTGAVPEAATWAMLVAGFAMVGVAGRRRAFRAA